MLQICILKEIDEEGNENVHINEVRDHDANETITEYNRETNRIDLSCLEGHEGETIMVTHFVRENGCTRIESENEKTLTTVNESIIEFN